MSAIAMFRQLRRLRASWWLGLLLVCRRTGIYYVVVRIEMRIGSGLLQIQSFTDLRLIEPDNYLIANDGDGGRQEAKLL